MRPQASPSEPVYLLAEEVADLLRCSAKSIYKLRKADSSMPALEFNGLIRFPRERLLEWLRQREQGAARIRSRVRMLNKSGASAGSAGPCADGCAADGAEAVPERR